MKKPMQKLVALDRMTYRTRRLLPGDMFEAKPSDARIFVLLKKAREQREIGKITVPPAALTRKIEPKPDPVADDLTTARAEYQTKMGKRPFMGWDAAEVRRRMVETPVEEATAAAPDATEAATE